MPALTYEVIGCYQNRGLVRTTRIKHFAERVKDGVQSIPPGVRHANAQEAQLGSRGHPRTDDGQARWQLRRPYVSRGRIHLQRLPLKVD